jgi:hypothetical protein
MTQTGPRLGSHEQPLQFHFQHEELLAEALTSVDLLAAQYSGGVQVAQVAAHLGYSPLCLVAALERGRHPSWLRDGTTIRQPVVERVRTDHADRTRHRYVLTADGRATVRAAAA